METYQLRFYASQQRSNTKPTDIHVAVAVVLHVIVSGYVTFYFQINKLWYILPNQQIFVCMLFLHY